MRRLPWHGMLLQIFDQKKYCTVCNFLIGKETHAVFFVIDMLIVASFFFFVVVAVVVVVKTCRKTPFLFIAFSEAPSSTFL